MNVDKNMLLLHEVKTHLENNTVTEKELYTSLRNMILESGDSYRKYIAGYLSCLSDIFYDKGDQDTSEFLDGVIDSLEGSCSVPFRKWLMGDSDQNPWKNIKE